MTEPILRALRLQPSGTPLVWARSRVSEESGSSGKPRRGSLASRTLIGYVPLSLHGNVMEVEEPLMVEMSQESGATRVAGIATGNHLRGLVAGAGS